MESRCPFIGLPKAARWWNAVATMPRDRIDPHTAARLRITPSTAIASAGSCFATTMAEYLGDCGYNYLLLEPGLPWLGRADNRANGYGPLSVRSGNVYSARQLVQLFDRAFGRFAPAEELWLGPDGAIVDPFRPRAQPGGYASAAECLADREVHFDAVRRMFREAEVFFFTLGQTEVWECLADGAILPICPGSGAGGSWDGEKYRFRNFTVAEVSDDLRSLVERLQSVNPAIALILAVSPVPLVATCDKRHVLQSSVYSASVMRVAAEETVRACPDRVDYFAAYEIMTATGNPDYLGQDKRTPSEEAVEHVMRSFFHQFCGLEQPPPRQIDTGGGVDRPDCPPCDEDVVMAAMALNSEEGLP